MGILITVFVEFCAIQTNARVYLHFQRKVGNIHDLWVRDLMSSVIFSLFFFIFLPPKNTQYCQNTKLLVR